MSSPRSTLEDLRAEAAGCTRCDLYRDATQTVFGEGAVGARVLFLGEQPGDREDREGHPFVGPAGRELDRALDEVGIARGDAYVTNVVKHFKFTRRGSGKVRIHQRPNREEITACRVWLDAELETVRPEIVVCLGATAAQALLGSSFRVTHHRGEWVEWDGDPLLTATVHPSSVLRSDDREAAHRAFAHDLRLVADALDGTA